MISDLYLEILLFLTKTLHLFHYYYLIKLRYYQWDLVNLRNINFHVTYFDIITSKFRR